MQENKFCFLFKKFMRKHIFKTSNIFLYIKEECSKHVGYWSYATYKKTNFDIDVYLPQLRRKPSILNTRLVYIVFKIQTLKSIFHKIRNINSCSLHFICMSLAIFFGTFFFFLSFFFLAPVRSLEGLIYSINMSLFRKDSMH